MSARAVIYGGGRIFDGETLHENHAARFEDGLLSAILPEGAAGVGDGDYIDLRGDILSAGFVDLQVNGGGGVMFGDAPSVEVLERIAAAHRGLGVAKFLPTLTSDIPEKTRLAVSAVREAVAAGVAGVGGLHLEGPHLSVEKRGAHGAEFIRPMTDADLALLLSAAAELPMLMVTVAPEGVSREQVGALSAAGAVVSLGHTAADFATCMSYVEAGARCVTHLFNAMSLLGSREPGLVGAALCSGRLSAGLIGDGVHVHPEVVGAAWRAKRGPGGIFLVSDAMAVAGSDLTEFDFGGRTVKRGGGRLTLADGTLAGADVDLGDSVRFLAEEVGVDLCEALRAVTVVPAAFAPDVLGGRLARLDEVAVLKAPT